MGAPTFEVRWGAATHAGRLRHLNEDSYLADPPVFVVADGMGGHARGDVASRTVIGTFAPLVGDGWLTPEGLDETVAAAAAAVRATAHGDAAAPGSTLAGVGLVNQRGVPCWLVFNIGDSRVYRIADGTLEQISVDHSKVQELLRSGRISVEEVRGHRQSNVITRALGAGMRTLPVADEWLLAAAAGERMLICSDGLSGELTDELIAATLLAEPDPQEAAEQLVWRAIEAGGRDNVTAVVVDAIEVRSSLRPFSSDLAGGGEDDLGFDDHAQDTAPEADLWDGLTTGEATPGGGDG